MMRRRRVLVTGGGGQDGAYLLAFLADKDVEVHAHSHREPPPDGPPGVVWHGGQLTEAARLSTLLTDTAPDEIYNLYSLSQPQLSLSRPMQALDANALAPQRIYEVVRHAMPHCRVFQASSSEIFGDTLVSPLDEETPCRPETPYAITKLHAHQMAGAYRRHFGLFICSGVLFNHESPRRPLSFVSQKIAHAAACVGLGMMESRELDERGRPIVKDGRVLLGNLDVRRDFGFAGDYVEAMWLSLQHDTPGDYVIGTGVAHSIREICEVAFAHVGRDWRDHVVVDPELIRAIDSRLTVADSGKARRELGWVPRTSFADLIADMVDRRTNVVLAQGAEQ